MPIGTACGADPLDACWLRRSSVGAIWNEAPPNRRSVRRQNGRIMQLERTGATGQGRPHQPRCHQLHNGPCHAQGAPQRPLLAEPKRCCAERCKAERRPASRRCVPMSSSTRCERGRRMVRCDRFVQAVLLIDIHHLVTASRRRSTTRAQRGRCGGSRRPGLSAAPACAGLSKPPAIQLGLNGTDLPNFMLTELSPTGRPTMGRDLPGRPSPLNSSRTAASAALRVSAALSVIAWQPCQRLPVLAGGQSLRQARPFEKLTLRRAV
jgi:hypothetical protein